MGARVKTLGRFIFGKTNEGIQLPLSKSTSLEFSSVGKRRLGDSRMAQAQAMSQFQIDACTRN